MSIRVKTNQFMSAISCTLITLGVATPGFAGTSEVVQAILGLTLSNSQVKHTVIHADGSIDGVFNGIAFAGNWTLKDGRYCREFTRGLQARKDCMFVTARTDSQGQIIGVEFEGASGRSYFNIQR